jgi:hypothetical protein
MDEGGVGPDEHGSIVALVGLAAGQYTGVQRSLVRREELIAHNAQEDVGLEAAGLF